MSGNKSQQNNLLATHMKLVNKLVWQKFQLTVFSRFIDPIHAHDGCTKMCDMAQ